MIAEILIELRQNFVFAGSFIVDFPSEYGQYLSKKICIKIYSISKILIETTSSGVHAVISLSFFK